MVAMQVRWFDAAGQRYQPREGESERIFDGVATVKEACVLHNPAVAVGGGISGEQ